MAKPHFAENISQKDKDKFSKFLSDDEELVLVTGYSIPYLNRTFIKSILFPGMPLILLGLLWAHFSGDDLLKGFIIGFILAILVGVSRVIMAHLSHRYMLTTRRIIVKKGFFSVDLTSALYDKITHIEVVQALMDRLLLHHGKVIVNTAGTNKQEIVLEFVPNPIEFKNILERLINREREHSGKSSGAVYTVDAEVVD